MPTCLLIVARLQQLCPRLGCRFSSMPHKVSDGMVALSCRRARLKPIYLSFVDCWIPQLHEQKRFIRDPTTCVLGCIPPDRQGKPKAAVHRQTSMATTARLFGQGVLGVNENDVTFSAAKLFFAYGLGNRLSFPLYTGATAVLLGGRVLPPIVNAIVREKRPTLFCGVPTLYSSLLASSDLPKAGEHNLRLCTSAGEPRRNMWGMRGSSGRE